MMPASHKSFCTWLGKSDRLFLVRLAKVNQITTTAALRELVRNERLSGAPKILMRAKPSAYKIVLRRPEISSEIKKLLKIGYSYNKIGLYLRISKNAVIRIINSSNKNSG